MTTMRKTVRIPSDRKLRLDLSVPEDVPPGDADVLVVFTVANRPQRRKNLSGLAGSLAGSKTFAGDAVDLQREIRDEW